MVWGLGFRVEDDRVRVQSLVLSVPGSGLHVQDLGFRVQGLGLKAESPEFSV